MRPQLKRQAAMPGCGAASKDASLLFEDAELQALDSEREAAATARDDWRACLEHRLEHAEALAAEHVAHIQAGDELHRKMSKAFGRATDCYADEDHEGAAKFAQRGGDGSNVLGRPIARPRASENRLMRHGLPSGRHAPLLRPQRRNGERRTGAMQRGSSTFEKWKMRARRPTQDADRSQALCRAFPRSNISTD